MSMIPQESIMTLTEKESNKLINEEKVQRIDDFKDEEASDFKFNLCKCLKKKKRKQGEIPFFLMDAPDGEEQVQIYKKERALHHWSLVRQWTKVIIAQNRMRHLATLKNKKSSMGFNLAEIEGTLKKKRQSKKCMIFVAGNGKFYLPPHGLFNSIWDLITSTILVYSMIVTPLVIVMKEILDEVRIYDFIFDCILCIDILLNFITAFQKDIALETDPKKIALSYLKSDFFFDVASTIPSLITFELYEVYWIKIFRITHFKSTIQHWKGVLQNILTSLCRIPFEKINNLIDVLKVLLSLCVVTHYCACIWLYLGYHYDDGWLFDWINENPCTKGEIYLVSYYWVITTLTSVGYGDFSANNEKEYLFTVLMECLGMAYFSFIMGTITLYFQNHISFQQIMEEKKDNLDLWLFRLDLLNRKKRLPLNLYSEVRKYLSNSFKNDFNLIIEDYEFFNLLPPRIKSKLALELFGDFRREFSFFFKGTEKVFISQFLVNLYSKKIGPDTTIISPEEPVREVYFIKSGMVTIYLKGGYNEILSLPPQSFFGETFVLLNLLPTVEFKTEEPVELMCISKKTLLELLDTYPESAKVLCKRAVKRRKILRKKKYETRVKQYMKIKIKRHGATDITMEDEATLSDSTFNLPLKKKQTIHLTQTQNIDEDSFSENELPKESGNANTEFIIHETSSMLKTMKAMNNHLSERIQGLEETILQNQKKLLNFIQNPEFMKIPGYKGKLFHLMSNQIRLIKNNQINMRSIKISPTNLMLKSQSKRVFEFKKEEYKTQFEEYDSVVNTSHND